jgi:transcriptional regulator with XRE-family HTH domain
MKDHYGILQHVGNRIREFRKIRGISQENFAFECQLDRTYISGIERGERNVSLLNLSTIASKLGVPLSRLFADIKTNTTANAQDVYRVNHNFKISCGFSVMAKDVTNAALATATQLEDLPFGLFRSIDLKALSGIVGALFAACLAENVDAIVNPIEKGHPDLIPVGGKNASEAQLRNYPEGLEIKCTVGNVTKGSDLRAGDERIDKLTGLTWQAHHREVTSLMGLVIDFSGAFSDHGQYPCLTGIFYTDQLIQDDWGKISGTTGRNTKVTGMRVSGKLKMGQGWVLVSKNTKHLSKYQSLLSFAVE